jgi:Zn-dependent protease with chaperone function
MSYLARRSLLVLALLFGLVFAVGIGVMYYADVPMVLAIFFTLFVVGLQYLLGPIIIDNIFTIKWMAPGDLSPEFGDWYRTRCQQAGIAEPRFGIIHDGNPNAFAYGRTRGDARIVITRGLLEVLSREETYAVVAHELGHVQHRDFIVMTVAQAAPLILYIIYCWIDRVRISYTWLVSLGAYAMYIVSQYIVLLLSRTREFFADEASAVATRDPNLLSGALIKIVYGLARSPAAAPGPLGVLTGGAKQQTEGKKKRWIDTAGATAALGIASARDASGFAMVSSDAAGSFSSTAMANAMQWELKNPWAKWFDINSTHPLTVRRVIALNKAAKRLGVAPAWKLESRYGSLDYTGHFLIEFLTYALPLIGALAGIIAAGGPRGGERLMIAYGLIGFGVGRIIKAARAYPALNRTVRTVEDLVGREINASPMSPVPCVVEGEIIGRGVPGLFYSPDLVLRDQTGFIRTLYRQPFGSISRFLFGALKADDLIGRKARIYGWYRRAQAPYLEIYRIETDWITGWTTRCYYKWWLFVSAVLMIAAGWAILSIL